MSLYFGTFLIDFAIAILFLLISFYLYSKYVYTHWKRNKIAQFSPQILFGDCKELILKKDSFGTCFQTIYKKIEKLGLPYGGFYFSLRKELMIVDLDVIKQIMVKDFQHFTDRGTFNDPKNDPLTAHLFALDGQKWKNLRTKLTPTFTSGKMKMMFPTLVACSHELENILDEKSRTGEPMDIKDYLARFTTDVIGSCAFGIDCNCLKGENTEFLRNGQYIFAPEGLDIYRSMGAFLMPDFFKTFKIKGFNANITNYFLKVVKDTVKYRQDNNIYRKDFMQLLLELSNNGKVQSSNLTDAELTDGEDVKINGKSNGHTNNGQKYNLTIEEIAAQCFVFFLAGFETSSTTMSFCLYELVKNPEIQDKLREEIHAALKKHNGELTYDAIMEMHYMDKVINETLRKYPPLPILIRRCTKDFNLPKSDYVLRKGDAIRISVLGIHRDPKNYPNPEKFDPERFSDEQKSRRHPMAWIPFGEGPRICIGLRFGMMQTKVGLSVLLKNHKFSLNEVKTQDPLVFDPKSLMLSTLGGIWLDAHKL